MEESHTPPSTILDQMIQDDQIQLLKAAIPYMPQQNQSLLSIMSKFMELQKTIDLFSNSSAKMHVASTEETNVSPIEFLQDIRQYASKTIQDQIDQLLNVFQTIQLMKLYQEMEEESV